jgi:hypothetical protein
MSWKVKLKNELKSIGIASLYFLFWFCILMLIKVLLLQEYHIRFYGISTAVVAALVVAKVILVMEHIPLGSWIQKQPAYVDVILRTILYVAGVFVILLLEKAFEGRDEYGGFWSSLEQVFNHADFYHVWIATICVTLALLSFNLLSLFRNHLGKGGLLRMLLLPPPEKEKHIVK